MVRRPHLDDVRPCLTPLLRAERTLSPAAIAHEEDLLADAATRVVLRPDLDAIAVVAPVGRLTGIITASHVQETVTGPAAVRTSQLVADLAE